ncbi:MAG: hypothetical protein IJS89_06690 [Bacteroidaceae bacterium]|nr:hypothetical protein [Bacteroidaceae bacterium]
MSFFSKLFKRKPKAGEVGWRVGGIEDFMTLIRVYYQSLMASTLGITNLAALPDLRMFKQTLKVPTAGNRLGVSEKNKSRKMLIDIYGLSEDFFKEIDASVKKRCRNMQAMQRYLYQFQGFSQELMMLMGNLMKWKFRLPGFMKGTLRAMTERTVRDVLTKDNWKDAGVRQAVANVRQGQATLGYSPEWMTEYVYNVVVLAKKEPKPTDTDEKK